MRHHIGSTILILALSILASSCNSILSDFDKLNPGEYASLIKRCARIVDRLPYTGEIPVSPKDRLFVKNHEPKFHATYTGYKTGSFKASWKIASAYIIMVEGNGRMTDDKCPIWVTVQRFEDKTKNK